MRNRLLPRSCLVGALLVAVAGCESPSTNKSPPIEAPTSDPPASSDAQGSAQAALSASNCNVLTTASVTANTDDGDGSVAANSQDDDLATRWSGMGPGALLTLDLGSAQQLNGAAIAWHLGNQRQNHFVLSTSEDGTTFTQAMAGDSALSTAVQTYTFSARRARYLRVTGNGNTVNGWTSVTEARACSATAPVPTVDSGPVLPRLPYLQSVGPTSALVAFRSGVSCTPIVRFGEGTDLSRTATASVAGWRHAVTLTGLQAGRTYGYSVEACGSTTGLRSFKTASPASTTAVHFTTMGDFGTGGSAQAQVIAMMVKPQWKGEFMLALGDNAYASGTEQEFQDHMFTPMGALLREVPMFATPGNHEYVTNQGQPYLDNLYLPTNNPAKSERYYSFDWGPVHVVSLDSNCAIGLASADRCTLAAQKAWLEQDLAATTRPWKIAFYHHPSWSSGEHGSQLTVRRNFGPIFEKYGVDLVLTGHDHEYERSKPMKGDAVAASGTKGIVYVVVGSGGATLRPFPSSQPSWTALRDNASYGFLDVTVNGGTLVAKLITTAGATRDSVTLTKTVATAVNWVTTSDATPPTVVETAPGPVDDPATPPAGLRFEKPLPPADRPEDTADLDEPAQEPETPAVK